MTLNKPAKVLVIDDDVTQRLLVKEYLEAAGYVVRLADDGRKGLSLAANTQPNIILLDLLLPSLDGYTVCTALKESPATAHIPVLLITGSRESNVIERGLSAGASDFITKPVDWDFLADRVEHVLRTNSSANPRAAANLATATTASTPAQPLVRDDAATDKALAKATQRINELTDQLAQVSRQSEEVARTRTSQEIQRIEREWAAKLQTAERSASAKEKIIEDRVQRGSRAVWQLVAIATARQIDVLTSLQKRVNGLALCEPADLVERAPATLAQVTGLVSKLHTVENNLRALAHHNAQTPAKEGSVDVGALLTDIANDASLLGTRDDVSVGCQCEPDLWLAADQTTLRMALAYIFENAIKFSPPNGFIQLEAHCLPNDSISLRVSDNGFGILPAQLNRLEACIESNDLSALMATGRAGIGLPMARAIAELHNGRIAIESGQDSGTRIALILPPERKMAKPDSAKQRLAAAVRRFTANGSA